MEEEMEELYAEGLATHGGPESCVDVGFQSRLPRRMYDVTAHGHAQHPDGESAGAGKPASVKAKAAAIDAAQAHPLTWKAVVRRVAAVAVAGAAIYLVLPKLIAVLGAWPRLSTLNPAWFMVCLAAELVSFTCNFALQRLALRTRGWFAVVTAGLAGNAVTNSLPGGDAAGAAVQFRMLTTAGFDTDTAVGGLTAFSLLEVGGLLALPLFALPAILGGAAVRPGLVHTALLGIAAFVLYAIFGVIVLRSDWPLATIGRVAQSLWNRVTRGHRQPVTGLDQRLLAERDTVRAVLGKNWRLAAVLTAGRLGFDYGCLLAALRATGASPQPSLVLLAYAAAGIVALFPVTPGGLGIVEASLSGLLILAGVRASYAVLATLAYRIASYWLPLLGGPPAYLLFRRRYGRPVRRRATPGKADSTA
jgi:uncharacterized protein (TIRG00374 family)